MTALRIAGAVAAMICAAPLAADAPESAQEREIVVQGQRMSVTTAIRQAIHNAGISQLARFEEPVCPIVSGLSAETGAAIERAIKGNIEALGGRVGKPGCAVNAVVMFDDNPMEFVRSSAKSQPEYFSAMTPREFKQFTDRPRPVMSWHVTEIRSRNGEEMGSADKSSQTKKIMTATVTEGVNINADVNRQAAATRLYSNTRQDITMAVAVIDRGRSNGKSVRQLADLATLHLLLDVRQDVESNNPASILSLFDPRPEGSAPPTALTSFDRGMVEGLYTRRANNLTAGQQFSSIAKAVERSAERERGR